MCIEKRKGVWAVRGRRCAVGLVAAVCLLCCCVPDTHGQDGNAGADKLAAVSAMNRQVQELAGAGKYAEAITVAQKALATAEQTLGARHFYVAVTLNNLAMLYQATGDNRRAAAMFQRALPIAEKEWGADSAPVLNLINNLAETYAAAGDYPRAEPLLRQALAAKEKALGGDNPELALPLSNLAVLDIEKGDFAQAETLLQRALTLRERALGPAHRDVALTLTNLADLYRRKGDFARALELHRRALEIDEKALGPAHPAVAVDLSNVGLTLSETGNYQAAEPLLMRAIDIDMKALGPDSAETATPVLNLADLYRAEGQYDKAEPIYQGVLAVFVKSLGPAHPSVAVVLANIAQTYLRRGEPDKAEPFLQQALTITIKARGEDHPDVATLRTNLASLYWAKGDTAQAVAALSAANDVRERNLALVLNTGSEEQKRLYMATLASETAATVSLHANQAPDNAAAERLALTTILRRKGRVLDAMSDQIGALRRRLRPEDQALLDQLAAAQSQLAALILKGREAGTPEEQAEVAALKAEAQKLQAAVSARSAEFRAQQQPVTLELVQQSLPADAALIELFEYQPFNPKAKSDADAYGPARYVAYILAPAGEPRWVELGDAAGIDAESARLRGALSNPRRTDVQELARALDERVMRPVRKLLGQTRRLFLSPDGALNLIPFGALVDEQNHYLIENYSITYLTSGRDLLRLREHLATKQPPLIFANPLFDLAQAPRAEAAQADGTNRRSGELSGVRFTPLAATAEEAKTLGTTLVGARVLTSAQATEAALKRVSAPSILHVATHGFFLPDEPQSLVANSRSQGITSAAPAPGLPAENPLLRSGIALAGANQKQDGAGEDGILTALEAAGLDLWGTKLVVLSACETGLGKVETGEGVYGLRRALVLAGAESQVMSLWQVSDAATRDLMVAYYQRLQAGEGRTEALRQVQLQRLHSVGQSQGAQGQGLFAELNGKERAPGYSHPFYWAAFIQSGDWRGMDVRDTAAK